ncbi:MAG: protein phosphatase 2C domain-containing protein [Pseudomonadota bacterium]
MVAATDTGNVRPANEDSLRIVPSINLAVVADGMGGHKAGDVASSMAVNTLCNFFEEQYLISDMLGEDGSADFMPEAFSLANSEVYANSHQLAHCEGMGTTLLAATFHQKSIHVGHIGDSRLYRFAKGELAQVTIDHTLAADMLQENSNQHVPAYAHHVLKKALGIEASCLPDFLNLTPEKNEIYLLCSDGLCGVVRDHDIATILSLRANDPENCIETLIHAALDAGAPDNVSVALVFVR